LSGQCLATHFSLTAHTLAQKMIDMQNLVNELCDTCPSGPLKRKVQVLVKDQYGTKVLHPHNDTAKTFASIAGTKTLTLPTIKHIMALGYSVEYVHEGVTI
jgi:hypothetical protein